MLAYQLELAGNIGSLFRLVDAFGVDQLYLSRVSESASNLKIRKVARATQKMVDYCYIDSELELVNQLKQEGHMIISLEITSNSLNIREFIDQVKIQNEEIMASYQQICLIVGSENTGIEQALLDASDHTLHIPMFGKNSSMNVAMAAAIALYELTSL